MSPLSCRWLLRCVRRAAKGQDVGCCRRGAGHQPAAASQQQRGGGPREVVGGPCLSVSQQRLFAARGPHAGSGCWLVHVSAKCSNACVCVVRGAAVCRRHRRASRVLYCFSFVSKGRIRCVHFCCPPLVQWVLTLCSSTLHRHHTAHAVIYKVMKGCALLCAAGLRVSWRQRGGSVRGGWLALPAAGVCFVLSREAGGGTDSVPCATASRRCRCQPTCARPSSCCVRRRGDGTTCWTMTVAPWRVNCREVQSRWHQRGPTASGVVFFPVHC